MTGVVKLPNSKHIKRFPIDRHCDPSGSVLLFLVLHDNLPTLRCGSIPFGYPESNGGLDLSVREIFVTDDLRSYACTAYSRCRACSCRRAGNDIRTRHPAPCAAWRALACADVSRSFGD